MMRLFPWPNWKPAGGSADLEETSLKHALGYPNRAGRLEKRDAGRRRKIEGEMKRSKREINVQSGGVDTADGKGAEKWPLGARPIDVKCYVSREFYEAEKQKIWRDSWLLAGREDLLPEPGDFFVTDLDFLDVSIVTIRGKDGSIRSFHNVCKHRGSTICRQPQGNTKALVCPFHGWVYDFEGRLKDVPFRDHFRDLPIERLSLTEVPTESWGGFIFFNLNPSPAVSLQQYMAPLSRSLRDYFGKERWRWSYGFKYPLKANWKTIIDVQHEGYHANFLHSATIDGVFRAEDMPVWAYPESRGVLAKLEFSQPDPEATGVPISYSRVAQISAKFGTRFVYSDSEAGGVYQRYENSINVHGKKRWAFDSYLIFPNVAFHIYADQLLVHRVLPDGPDRSIWLYDWFFLDEEPRTFGELFGRTYYVCAGRDIISEDTTTVEGNHRAYRSGVVDRIYLSDLELAVRAFEERVLVLAGTLGG